MITRDLRRRLSSSRLIPLMPPQVKRRPTEVSKTCDVCGGSYNVRGFGRHAILCHPTPPTTNAVVSTNPEPGEDGTLHAPHSLTS